MESKVTRRAGRIRHVQVRGRQGASAEANESTAKAMLESHPTGQCPSVSATRASAVFCTKRAGHEGDHRGYRAQWNAAGERVAITEPTP